METQARAVMRCDAVVVGAGFAGMYALHRLRQRGLSIQVFEAGDDVGGTWYWNRYPGARCDVESVEYQYGFSDEIARGWTWTERYAAQPEIMRYADYVAKRLDLRKNIKFESRVTSAIFDDESRRWTVETDRGDRVFAQFCIMATGCLSASRVPEIAGRETFRGPSYHTGAWPHDGVDFSGKRVAVIGTGSSGVQSIPVIAAQAERLFVFQRTPNFSLPALNAPMDPDFVEASKESFAADRKRVRATNSGAMMAANDEPALGVTLEERQRNFEARWGRGGFAFMTSYNDLFNNIEANRLAADFVRDKIRKIVTNPQIADLLAPTNHPIGTKRLCLDTNYYETYNLPHVTLIDITQTPIERITPGGLSVGGREYAVDSIVFATGFDAMTGALLRIDIRGRDGLSLREKWTGGPRTYLGLGIAGFPNLFTITGPGSPSVLVNVIIAIEQHVDWIADCIDHLRANGFSAIEAQVEAEDRWVEHVNQKADETLYPLANSWYVGANVPGKPRVFMPYVGGFANYDRICAGVAAGGYEGFSLA
ncbi:MAG: Cyclohexanone monooxygenase [Rhodospirillales bacterium]|nr:Cyclohexanone monooxygenase [Rhodospirillales bacterium]